MNAILLDEGTMSNMTSRAIPLNVSVYLLNVALPLMTFIVTIIGIFGFIGNAITFLQVELRKNTCCIYTFCSSCIDFSHILINVFPDYLRGKYAIPTPWNVNDHWCKFYNFIYSFLPQLAINFLILSIIDRFACTCHLSSRLHRLNELKMAPRMICGAVAISAILSTYAPIMSKNGPLGCYISVRRPFAICNIIINGIMQPVVMLIFVLLTYRNVLLSRKRVGQVSVSNPHRSRNQFVWMIMTQVMATATLSLQWMSGQIYVLFTVFGKNDIDGIFQALVLLTFTLNFYAMNNVKSFYFSMLTSQVYRETFVKGIKRIFRRCRCR